MCGYLYILESEGTGKHYVGSTNNPERRLSQHNGNAVAATRNKGPWRFARLLAFPDASTARQAEHHLKKQKSRAVVEAVVAGQYAWPDQFAQAMTTHCRTTGDAQ